MRSRKSGPIATFIFGTIFFAVGAGLMYFWGWPVIVESKASRSWASTLGKITVSEVESKRGSKGKTTYAHHVEYTFDVNGVQHVGDRVWIGDGWSSSNSSGARRTISKYPVGSETTVYYDSEAPEKCALQPGTTWMTYLPMGLGSMFFLIGSLLVGSVLIKLIVVTMILGAAATTGDSVASTSPKHESRHDSSRPPADHDDGINIT